MELSGRHLCEISLSADWWTGSVLANGRRMISDVVSQLSSDLLSLNRLRMVFDSLAFDSLSSGP